MGIKEMTKVFIADNDLAWEQVDHLVQRKIMSYDDRLMLVKVKFETGGIGTLHHHEHTQISLVESGVFEVEIAEVKMVLKAGDCFYIPPNAIHGVVCIQAGVLIDTFSPMREDFIK